MAAQTIYNEIDLSNTTYTEIDLSGKHCFYLISVAQDNKVKSITFSIAIDSGVQNNPLQIQYITLPVNEGISGVRFTGFPDEFYIKPTQVTLLKDEQVVKSNIDNTPFDIEVNISPLDLG